MLTWLIWAASNLTILFLSLALSGLTVCSGFNVNTRHPIMFSGPSDSYFGFTVALLKTQAGLPVLLVGAPKANSTLERAGWTSVEPGAVLRCDVFGSGSDCPEVPLSVKGPDKESHHDFMYDELRDNGWLGVSLDVSPDDSTDDSTDDASPSKVAACAHLWKNQKFKGNYLTNGICYVVDSELTSQRVRRLLPLVDASKQVYETDKFRYAFGGAGISVHFVRNVHGPNSADLLMGAPGVWDWRGSVAYSEEPEYSNVRTRPRFHVPVPPPDYAQDSYFGYSVSSGSFYEKGEVEFVAGAPRDGPAGSVYIFYNPAAFDDLTMRMALKGTQLGEYFGGAVCALDLNNDDFSDLVVGAPLYTKLKANSNLRDGVDEGKVYVYMNDGNGRLVAGLGDLLGSSSPSARFGSALSAIGDVNQDGYADLAVGAPYEHDRGAVYIYHGAAEGPRTKHVQRIFAGDVDGALRGFGMSISRGKDVDDNKYLDLAVGSYASDRAVVLRSQPVVSLHGEIQFNISQLNLHTPNCVYQNMATNCFKVSACISYAGSNAPGQLDVEATLEVDTMKHRDDNSWGRVVLLASGDPKSVVKYNALLNEGQAGCKDFTAHVLNTTTDVLTPVEFRLNFIVARKPELEPFFCRTCAVAEPRDKTSVAKKISFLTNCGTDDRCDAELHVQAQILGYSDGATFILGSSRTLTLEVAVKNKGEPAYLANVNVLLPAGVDLVRAPPICHSGDGVDLERATVHCDLGNPFGPHEQVLFEIEVDVTQLKSATTELEFALNASTASNDLADSIYNALVLGLPVQSEGDITVSGKTDSDQIVYAIGDDSAVANATTVKLQHRFEITKFGFTPIKSVTVSVNIPQSSLDDQNTFMKLVSAELRIGPDVLPYGACGRPSPATDDDGMPTTWTMPTSGAKSRAFKLDCLTTRCLTLECRVGPFLGSESATISFNMEIYLHNLVTVTGLKEIVAFATSAHVVINDESYRQPLGHRPDYAEAVTDLIDERAKPPANELAGWVIPVCVIAGILLLLLIGFALFKFGFFRRAAKEDMEEKMLHSAELDSAPAGNSSLLAEEGAADANA